MRYTEESGARLGCMAQQRAAFAEYLTERMAERGITQRRLAAYAEVSPNTVSLWLRGATNPKPETLRKLVTPLRRPFEELMQAAGHGEQPAAARPQPPAPALPSPEEGLQRLMEAARAMLPERIPVQEGWVHAGDVGPDGQFVYRQPEWHGRRIVVFTVRGDCMEPEVKPGDRVVVDLDLVPEDGDMVIVRRGDEALVRVYDARNQHLISWNGYAPLAMDEVQQVATVIEVARRVRGIGRRPRAKAT